MDHLAVGTKMGVSADAPYFDIAYKLVKYAGYPVMKLSTGKKTLVDQKQVFRFYDNRGNMARDVIALRREKVPGGQPLLEKVMEQGRIKKALPDLKQSREYFASYFALLPPAYKDIENPATYPVSLGPGLEHLQNQVEQEIRERELGES